MTAAFELEKYETSLHEYVTLMMDRGREEYGDEEDLRGHFFYEIWPLYLSCKGLVIGEQFGGGEVLSISYVAIATEPTKEWYEFAVIEFKGGSILPINIHMNSCNASLRDITEKLDGGDYGWVKDYTKLLSDPKNKVYKLKAEV